MHQEERAIVPTETRMRRAVAERDAAYDDRFLYGVVTTGVYCLPSCAARPARPENLRFYFSARDAERAGLRACKRCRPGEAGARRRRLVEIARELAADPSRRRTLAELAARLDLSPSAFQKVFKNAFGVSPKAYQDAARLSTFKGALKDGSGVMEAVFEAGYGSTSRVYGESLRNIGMTPSAYRRGGEGETIHHACRETVLGALLMAATERGVCFAQFGPDAETLVERLRSEFPRAALVRSAACDSDALDRWVDALEAHLAANGPRPDLPLDLRGTAFQIQVWRALLGVSEGEVVSYGELAARLGRPRAVRATASACAANRIAILVPCHRVLRGDGGLGGYRWGEARKRALLDAERRREAAGS